MTSKRLFFKVMREDMRRRVWMAALSVLESFLALPVAWLIFRNHMGGSVDAWIQIHAEQPWKLMNQIFPFFSVYLTIVGSLIVVSSVLTAGLGGFRFLFHKNMIDTYHSLPVSRSVLFGACYVNGILLWFVPFFAGLSSALTLAGGLLYEVAGGAVLKALIWEAARCLLVLTVVFLLLYNLTLAAVMLSGNVLNSLVSMLIMGFGASAAYGMVTSFMEVYLNTFYDRGINHRAGAIYASPLLSTLYLLVTWEESPEDVWEIFFVNLGIAVLLGLWAWRMYRKRSSELAEQGIRNRIATVLFRVFVSVLAGMCGWMIFVVLTDVHSLSWGIFGGVFMGMLAFGVMNVVFTMDFKSFFAHKRQMAFTLAATLILCCAFRGDWVGYDVYLPGGQIAEIAVYQSSLNNDQYYSGARANILQGMHIQDEAVIRAFLERMVERGRDYGDAVSGDTIVAKVTPAHGKSYYREYLIREEDRDVLWPLLSSPEYLREAYCVDETADWYYFAFVRGRETVVETHYRQDVLDSIIRAYNQDVLENPRVILEGGERLLGEIELRGQRTWWQEWLSLGVYESMEHTVEALRQAGYGEWVETPDPSEIEAVEFKLWYTASRPLTSEEIIAEARDAFGTGSDAADRQNEYYENDMYADGESEAEAVFYDWRLRVTDPDEIEELASCLSYAAVNDNIFHSGYAAVTVTGKDGSEKTCYIQCSMLPEKYILRFGEL